MFDITPDEARLLLDIALMATGKNRFQSAETLLSALEDYRPDSEPLATARMILLISRGEAEAAVHFADCQALPKHPNAAMLKAFKGMALLRLDRREQALQPLREAAAQTVDPVAAQLAKDLMP